MLFNSRNQPWNSNQPLHNFSLSNLNLIHVILMILIHAIKCVRYYPVFTCWQWGTFIYVVLFCYSPGPGHRYYIIIQIIHSKCHYTHYHTLYRQNRLHKPQPSPASDIRNILIKSIERLFSRELIPMDMIPLWLCDCLFTAKWQIFLVIRAC